MVQIIVCGEIAETVNAILGKPSSSVPFTIKDVEVAFLHVRRCSSCRDSLTAEEHWTFVSRVLLEKE